MANVGPIISLASIAAVRDEIEYLEDEMDLDHAGYTLTSIKTFGNTTIADFPNQCAELNKRYNEWNPLTRGAEPASTHDSAPPTVPAPYKPCGSPDPRRAAKRRQSPTATGTRSDAATGAPAHDRSHAPSCSGNADSFLAATLRLKA